MMIKISPLAIALMLLGLCNTLIGLASLTSDILVWRDWFAAGVVNHYRDIRNLLFGLFPFSLPNWAKDAAVIYSGFVFWAAQVARHDINFLAERYGSAPLGWVVTQSLKALFGPFYFISMALRLSSSHQPNFPPMRRRRPRGYIVSPSIRAPVMRAELEQSYMFDEDQNEKGRASLFIATATITLLFTAAAFIGILFLATNIKEKLLGG